MTETSDHSGHRILGLPWTLLAVGVVCIIIELILTLSDAMRAGGGSLRFVFYDYGSFLPGLLGDWEPNYAAQPYTMFVTYGFLHGGFSHLLVNMLTLWSLGMAVVDRVGQRRFLLLYVASLFGGAMLFGLLAPPLRSMVGASGALFGLAGGLLAWAYVDRFTARMGLWPIVRMAVFLIVMNVVMWWALDGQLAWETHLGGFLVGWIMALLIDPRPQIPPEDAPNA